MRNVPHKRSPNFPILSLRKALDKATLLYELTNTSFISVKEALAHFGYMSAISSSAMRTISAMRAFGLIHVEGGARVGQKVRISEIGKKIISSDHNRSNLLKKVALTPPLFAAVWEMRTDDKFPTNEVIWQHLHRELKFNENTIPNFIAALHDTLVYAGLLTENQDTQTHKLAASESNTGPCVRLDLPRNNMIEIHLRAKVTPAEFQMIMQVYDLSRIASIEG